MHRPSPLSPLLWLALLIAPSIARGQAPPRRPAPTRPPAAASDKGAQPAAPPATGKAEVETVGPIADEKPFFDLTHRYRFAEQYTKDQGKARGDMIGQYAIRIWEELTDTIDSAAGPTKPIDITRETIYTERPADVNGLGSPAATIRSYSKFLVRPDDVVRTKGPRPLDGLTIWYRPQSSGQPFVMSLSGERPLREREFEVVTRQVFVPHLTGLLPGAPVRVGDGWRVPHKAVQALLGESDLKGDQFNAKFRELRRSKDERTTFAIVGVNGRVMNKLGDTLVTAQVVFTFPTPAAAGTEADLSKATTAAPPRGDEYPIEAKGAITEVRMGRLASGVLPSGPDKGRTFHASQKLVLERKLATLDPGAVLLKTFDAPPENSTTSWLTYEDPANRFTFTHPQDMLPPDKFQFATDFGPDSVLLVKTRPEGRELVRIEFFPKEQTPESLKEMLNAQWKQMQVEVLPGNERWLDESDWPRMKVYHIEAALKPPSRGPRSARIHYDAYLIRLDNGASLFVVATTTKESVEKFRAEVERMLKTFRLARKAGA